MSDIDLTASRIQDALEAAGIDFTEVSHWPRCRDEYHDVVVTFWKVDDVSRLLKSIDEELEEEEGEEAAETNIPVDVWLNKDFHGDVFVRFVREYIPLVLRALGRLER